MPFIHNHKLSLGNKQGVNLGLLMKYIYYVFPLDHDQMCDYYLAVKVPIKFDSNNGNNDVDYDQNYYRDYLKFLPNARKDKKYIYTQDALGDLYDDLTENKFIKELDAYLQEESPQKLKICGVTSLTVKNINGVNDDVRGIRNVDWKLHYWPTYTLEKENGIRLHDLIIAAYKIRSHKFENWYEMYGGIDDFELDDDSLTFSVGFDHGS